MKDQWGHLFPKVHPLHPQPVNSGFVHVKWKGKYILLPILTL